MFQEAVQEQRKIEIKQVHEKDQAGNTNSTGNEPSKAVGREECTPIGGMSRWGKKFCSHSSTCGDSN